jgi:Fur family zinc uptake transcriptional regulator
MKPKHKKTPTHKPHEEHGHDHAAKSRKAHKLSTNEASVEKILARAKKPMSAYDIIPIMTKKLGHTVAPVTVYRALQSLTEQGLVTRIESKNAYILCRHPDEEHACLFFICRNCGTAMEGHDEGIRGMLAKEAKTLGFGIDKPILEVVGLCLNCAG